MQFNSRSRLKTLAFAACAVVSLAMQVQGEESSDCATALQKPAIRDLDEHVERLGVKYEEMLGEALRGHHCTRSEIVEFLSTKRGFAHQGGRNLGKYIVEYYRYRAPFPRSLIWFDYGISFRFSIDGELESTNWQVHGVL